MSAVRDYLKTQPLFTMQSFLSKKGDPGKKVWFLFDESGKVTGHSLEPVEKEWDGLGQRPVIVDMGFLESEARLSENWKEFIVMAEEEEGRQRGG